MADIITIPDGAIIYDIDLDLHNKTICHPVYAKQYDANTRYIRATIWNNGTTYTLQSSSTIYFAGTKFGNIGIDNYAGIDTYGRIIYKLSANDTATTQSYEAEFRIVDDSINLRSSPKFKIFIEKSALQDGTPIIVEEGSVTVSLQKLKDDIEISIAEINEVIQEFYSIPSDKFGINDAVISKLTAWSSDKINNLYTTLYDRMGLMPVDGGTFFENYDDWIADAGTF